MKIIKKYSSKIFFYILLVLPLILFVNCEVIDENNGVKIWCLQDDSQIMIVLENKTDSAIFIPKDYTIQSAGLCDTAYFEGIYKKKYALRKYYYYSKFSKPVRSLEKIEGLKYDAVKTIEHNNIVPYQFNPPEMIGLAAGKTIKIEIKEKINKHYGSFRFYKTRYPLDPNKNYSDYHSYDAFISYENNNSYLLVARIYQGE